ncbi:MAG: polysaccharide biosynthesis protein [Acidobacteriaceae bacterium]|nr:polysaccharide biosynthesis protein [Acidobacteriaceae bacterium]
MKAHRLLDDDVNLFGARHQDAGSRSSRFDGIEVRRHTLFRRLAMVMIYTALAAVIYCASFLIRFDDAAPAIYIKLMLRGLPVFVGFQLVGLWMFGAYDSPWRYAGVVDLSALIKATTLAVCASATTVMLSGRLGGFPRSIFCIDWTLSIVGFGGARFAIRLLSEGSPGILRGERKGLRVLIIGAGSAAEMLLRQLRRDPFGGLHPVALVDDDMAKWHTSLHGVPVAGGLDQIGRVAQLYGATTAIVAIGCATHQQMFRIVACCRRAALACKVIPSLSAVLQGKAELTQIRDVSIDDLLGRGAIHLDLSEVERQIRGNIVLITGGAGSIGSELAQQVAKLGPARLVLVEIAESPLYFIQLELQEGNGGLDVVAVIADVTDEHRMSKVFEAYRPHIVIHAAAYKHVPLMEANVFEAVRNNVCGTLCVAHCAGVYGAARFVLISTDKAVRPSSVMGATKRVAERVVLGWPDLRRFRTDFRIVRFGNVLGSNGSVIPLFQRQLAKGGPLTVTHPDATRYFMTISEACQLVLLSTSLPEAAGRIAMLEMGEPVKIKELAENIIRCSGLEPYVDVPLCYVGLRPGEKLTEDLMSSVERTVATKIDKIRLVDTVLEDPAALTWKIGHLLGALAGGEAEELLDALVGLVPEAAPPLTGRTQPRRNRRPELREIQDGCAASLPLSR